MNKLYKNKEFLYQKYIIKKLSAIKIAIICECNDETIRNWLKKYNIKIRTVSEANTKKWKAGEHWNCISIKKRLEEYHTKQPDECWNWIGTLDKDGYGKLKINGKNQRAHRASWEFYNKIVPNDLFVCHHCDNPSCVNPEHLFLGTCQDNTNDKINKNRQAKGSKNGNSVLKENQVKKIKQMLSKNTSIKKIAKIFNVGKSTIRHIKDGRTWKHI